MNEKIEGDDHTSSRYAGDNGVELGAGLAGASAATPFAAASDEMVKGMDAFRDMASRVQNKLPVFQRGHLFEAILAAKENAAAAQAGSSVRTHVTHLEGHNTAPADLERRSGSKVVSQAQAKFSMARAENVAEMVADPKYRGMDRYVPSKSVDNVRRALLEKAKQCTDPVQKANYLDAAKNLVAHDTRGAEVWAAQKAPRLYALGQEVKYVGKEAAVSGAWAAGTAAIVGGGISIIKNMYGVAKGEIDGGEAVEAIAKDTGKAAARGGATGAGGAVLRHGAQKAGLRTLAKANVATAIAAGMVDCGVTVYRFAHDEISQTEAMEQIGQNGVSTMSSIYAGAAAGLAFGPVGAVIGSMAGYMIASSTYQSCLAIMKNAQLAEEAAQRMEALCDESIRQMRLQQDEFRLLLDKKLHARAVGFESCFSAIEKATSDGTHDEAVSALANLAGMFGTELKFASFEKFDDFMCDREQVLVL